MDIGPWSVIPFLGNGVLGCLKKLDWLGFRYDVRSYKTERVFFCVIFVIETVRKDGGRVVIT